MQSMFVVAVSVFGMLLFGNGAWAQTPAVVTPHFYALEHSVVEYEISGAVKGKEVLYFDQWGMRQARHKIAETQRWGTLNTVTLNLGAEIVIVDPNKNLGQKKEDQNLKQLLAQWKSEDMDVLSLRSLILQGGKKIKDDTVLDRVCEVWEVAELKMKVWVWNGIFLKMETETPEGIVIYTAVKIDEAMVIDEKFFVIPEGIQFIDHDLNEILIS